LRCVGFEVLTAVVMKRPIFWDIMQCSPVGSQPTFRRNMSPPSLGSKNKPSTKPRKEQGSACYLLHSGFFLGLLFHQRRHVPPKRRLTFNGLHGIILWHVRLRSRRYLVTASQAAEEEGVTRKRLATKQCQGRVSYGVGSQAIYRDPCSTAAGVFAGRVTSEYTGRAAVLQLQQWVIKCIHCNCV
jgi:hypothetical protein